MMAVLGLNYILKAETTPLDLDVELGKKVCAL